MNEINEESTLTAPPTGVDIWDTLKYVCVKGR